jgi:hypothetical protein
MNGRFKRVLLNAAALLGVAGTGILTGLPGLAQTTPTPQQPDATTGGETRQQVELNPDATQPGTTGQATPGSGTQPSPGVQTSPTTTPGTTDTTTPGTTTPGATTPDTTTPETTTPGATTPTTTTPGTTTGSEQPADDTGTAAEQPTNQGVRALW